MAAALLTPDQPDWVLGAELIVIGGITSWVLLGIRRVKHNLNDDDQQLIAIFNRRGPNVMVMLLFAASGISLVCGAPAGLYLLLPTSLVAQVAASSTPGTSSSRRQAPTELRQPPADLRSHPGQAAQALGSQRSMQAISSSVSTGLVT